MNGRFEAVMNGLVEPGGPGAAVGLRHGDQPPYLAGFGLADVEWGTRSPRIPSSASPRSILAFVLLRRDRRLKLGRWVGGHLAVLVQGGQEGAEDRRDRRAAVKPGA